MMLHSSFYILGLAKDKLESQENTLMIWYVFTGWQFSLLLFLLLCPVFIISFPYSFFFSLWFVYSFFVCAPASPLWNQTQRRSHKHNHLFLRKRKEARVIIISVWVQKDKINGSVTLSRTSYMESACVCWHCALQRLALRIKLRTEFLFWLDVFLKT